MGFCDAAAAWEAAALGTPLALYWQVSRRGWPLAGCRAGCAGLLRLATLPHRSLQRYCGSEGGCPWHATGLALAGFASDGLAAGWLPGGRGALACCVWLTLHHGSLLRYCGLEGGCPWHATGFALAGFASDGAGLWLAAVWTSWPAAPGPLQFMGPCNATAAWKAAASGTPNPCAGRLRVRRGWPLAGYWAGCAGLLRQAHSSFLVSVLILQFYLIVWEYFRKQAK